MNKSKEDLRARRDMFMDWKTHILKMSVQPRLIYVFILKSPSRMFSREDDFKIFKGIQNKNKVRGIMLPDFKPYLQLQ